MVLSRRTFSKLVGASALSGVLASSSSLVSAQEDAAVLRIVMNVSDIANLNPHFATTTQDRAIVDMVFNGLVRFSPGTSTEFEPDTAFPVIATMAEQEHIVSGGGDLGGLEHRHGLGDRALAHPRGDQLVDLRGPLLAAHRVWDRFPSTVP